MDTIQDNIPIEFFVSPERSSGLITCPPRQVVSDISDIDNNKPIEKQKKRKEPTRKNNTEATAWRRRPDGTYDHRPLDPD